MQICLKGVTKHGRKFDGGGGMPLWQELAPKTSRARAQ
jgi:hypothetical protein